MTDTNATVIPSSPPTQQMLPNLDQSNATQVERVADDNTARDAAELESFIDQDSRDNDPDAHGEHASPPPAKAPKPPARATAIEDENVDDEGPNSREDDGNDDEREDEQGDKSEADDKTPKGKKSVGERIKELTRNRGEAERRATAAEERAAALEARLEALERGEKPPARTAPKADAEATEGKPKPTPPNANDTKRFRYGEFDPEFSKAKDAYLEELADWTADQKLAARDKAAAEENSKKAQAAQMAELEGKRDALAERGVAEFGEEYLETVIVAAAENKFPISPTVALLTLESEVGHMVAHHLATHPKEAGEVYGKSPAAQAAYFGRLEERFLTAKAAKKPPETKRPLPAPPKHVARGAGGQFTVDASTEDFAAFEAAASKGK